MRLIKTAIVKPILADQYRYSASGNTTALVRKYIAFQVENVVIEELQSRVYDKMWASVCS